MAWCIGLGTGLRFPAQVCVSAMKNIADAVVALGSRFLDPCHGPPIFSKLTI